MKKRTAVMIAVLVLLVALTASGTVAHFAGEAQVTNVITTGTINIRLNETTTDASGAEIPWPEAGVDGVVPGRSVDKKVSVTNTGTADAWVRVKVDITAAAQPGEILPALDDLVSLDIQEGWLKGADGCYYYKTPLAAEAETTPLFTRVAFSSAIGNEFQSHDIDVAVTAQAVQYKNNAGAGETPITELTAENLTQIKGWAAWSVTP